MTVSRGLHLRPALTCVWPEPSTVQIGVSRRAGLVLRGLAPEDTQLIEALRSARGLPGAPVSARGEQLLHLLHEAGLLSRGTGRGVPPRLRHDAWVWALAHSSSDDGAGLIHARADRSVTVVGAGRLGTTLAATLAAGGVGSVTVADARQVFPEDAAPAGATFEDDGRHRRDVAAERVRLSGARACTASRLEALGLAADVVVLVEHGAADATTADTLVSADVTHLSVVVRDAEVVVGPLVDPGDGACLRCLDLHRADRDPRWPATLNQVLAAFAERPGPEEIALSTLASGLAAVQVLAALDRLHDGSRVVPASSGATLEVDLPQGLVARRAWSPHPRCGCRHLDPATGHPGARDGQWLS